MNTSRLSAACRQLVSRPVRRPALVKQRHVMAEPSTGSGTTTGAGRPADPSPQQAMEFLTLLQELKLQKRTGWINRQVMGPESIADHMYRMGMMAMLVQGSQYDYQKCMKLALVHDVAEAIVGDITPHCGVTEEDKYSLECQAMEQIKATLGSTTAAAEEIAALWHEYEQGRTPEAQLVKDFDKLEMILQAQEYEHEQGVTLQEFFDSTAGKWRTEIGRQWAEEIYRRRQLAAEAEVLRQQAEAAAQQAKSTSKD